MTTVPTNASPLRIRPARAEDAAGLAQVYLDSGRHHTAIDPAWHQVPDELTALARIRTKLADAEAALFVAEAAGEIVGLLELRLVAPAPAGIIRPRSSAQVGVAVREGRRGHGIGAALMAFAERWALEHGCATMILDMSAANAGALRFYERLGYQTYGLLLRKSLDASPRDGG